MCLTPVSDTSVNGTSNNHTLFNDSIMIHGLISCIILQFTHPKKPAYN